MALVVSFVMAKVFSCSVTLASLGVDEKTSAPLAAWFVRSEGNVAQIWSRTRDIPISLALTLLVWCHQQSIQRI